MTQIRTCECGCNIVNHYCGGGFCSGDEGKLCDCKQFVPNHDEYIYNVHSEIAHRLQYAMGVWADQEREARELAEKCARRRNVVRSAVAQGQWWLLEDELEKEEIELLCNTEPTNRLSLLDEPWE